MNELDAFTAYLVSARLKLLQGKGRWPLMGHYKDWQRPHLRANGQSSYIFWDSRNKLPSAALRPKKVNGKQFIGQFTDLRTTLVQEGTQPHAYPGFSDVSEVNVLLQANLYSTGRGTIGRVARLLVAREQGNNYTPDRSVQYLSLPEDSADLAVELLLAESESTARAVAVRGLQHIVSAGLPGLGKA